MVFEPVILPASGILNLNAGKSFTFGLSHNMELDLAKEFVIHVNLKQTDLEKYLSKAQIDITNIFQGILNEMGTTVEFTDDEGEIIAHMEVLVRLFPSGPIIINEFISDSGHQKQTTTVRNGRGCPRAPGFKHPNGERDDEGEWDIMCAELQNGQKIAMKYKRSYYGMTPTQNDELCSQLDGTKMTRSEEKLNTHILELMEKMHMTITKNATII